MRFDKDFAKEVVKALKKRGITIVGATWVPGKDGSYANGETAYRLNDNGTSKLRTYLEVVALAGGAK